MALSVLENAYLRLAEKHADFSVIHKKVMLALLFEKKYYQKDELLCFSNYCEKKLDNAIADLEDAGLAKTEGWLVKLAGIESLEKELLAELPQESIKVRGRK